MISQVDDHREELYELCRRYDVERLELFGSASTDDFDADHSDLDFLVEYSAECNLGPWLKEHFEFQEALERLFGLPVDLVMATAIKSDRLLREVNRTRQTVYAAQDPQMA